MTSRGFFVLIGVIINQQQGHIDMTYIWNRAERVPEHLMPHAVTRYFNEWLNERHRELSLTDNTQKRLLIHNKIEKQTKRYNEAIEDYNNKKNTLNKA